MFDLLLSLLGDAAILEEFAIPTLFGVLVSMGMLTAFPVMYLCDIIANLIRGLFKIK